MAERIFNFPVQSLSEALTVLKPSFDITHRPELYVDFSSIRAKQSFGAFLRKLCIFDDVYESSGEYIKILYTGHTGCGKSTELVKLHEKLNNSDRYFSIYIDVQDAVQISSFRPEDLFLLLITKLIERLQEENVSVKVSGLKKLADEWINEEPEITKEVERGWEGEAGAEIEAGFSFWKLLSAKGTLKNTLSYGSKTSETIRRKVRENQGAYITIFNEILYEIRSEILTSLKGREILFILDGIEKLRQEQYNTYIQAFFTDARLISDLKANVICCVPIDSLYDVNTIAVINSDYESFTLPMIGINEATKPYFQSLISKRINLNTFFEEGILDYCIEMSGGNPRQLIRIVATALTYVQSDNLRISLALAEKVCKEMGLSLRRTLTSEHFAALQDASKYEDADKIILDLLFSLALMEYNGDLNKRQPNPLILPYLNQITTTIT